MATKGFSWIDKKLLGDIGEIKLEEKNGKYKLTKIAQRKTSEKYADTGAGNDKKEFHFRYKIYLGGPLQVRALSNTVYAKDINDNMKLAVLKHFGYDFTKQLGKGGYGTAYLDSKKAKNGIMRVIKVCLNDEIEIKKEWKGVNTAYKIFDKIKNLDSDTKKLREEFYKNESIVFNKNKAMGQISEITGYTTEPRYERYWYCISTSEYRTGGEAFSVSDEDRELFKNDNKALWIELQAFAKDILTGLSIFHKQDTAHLDVKLANIFKTKTSVKDGGSKYKYAIADHTMAFNKADFNKKFSEKNKTTNNQDFIKSYTTSLSCGTPGYMAPENPYKNQKESNYVLP